MHESLTIHAEIFRRLGSGTPEDVREAGRLCARLPNASPEIQRYIDDALFSTAFALELLGDLEEAIGLYRRVKDCPAADPGYRANAGFRYGLVCEKQGRPAESPDAYRFALELSPLGVVARAARQRLSGMLLLEGNFREALPHLEALIGDSEVGEAERLICELRRVRSLVKLGKFDPAQQDRRKLLPPAGPVDPDSIGPWMQAAIELEMAGEYELARDFYARLLEMDGVPSRTRTDCHFRLGLVHESLVNWDESFRHYRAAVDAPLEFPEAQAQARLRLAELQYLSEDYEAAAEHFVVLRSAPEIAPQQRTEAHFRYGVSLLRLGRLDEARSVLESCRERLGHSESPYAVKCDLSLAEIFERRNDRAAARACYGRVIGHPCAEPLTKAAALNRLHRLR